MIVSLLRVLPSMVRHKYDSLHRNGFLGSFSTWQLSPQKKQCSRKLNRGTDERKRLELDAVVSSLDFLLLTLFLRVYESMHPL